MIKTMQNKRHTATIKIAVSIMFAVILMCLPVISAMTWDNTLTYSNNDLKIELKNWFGLGTNYGSAELKSHKTVNEVRKVGAGSQVVMWYDFDFNELYKNGIGEVNFIDMRTGKSIDKDYSFVYLGEAERDVRGKGKCSLSINGTETCESVVIGTETYETWLPYNSKDIPNEKIRIGLKTNVEVDDYVDGIWTIGGKKVSRHATWTANLDVDLKLYYRLDETSGAIVISEVGTNGTQSSMLQGEPGLINTGYKGNNIADAVINSTQVLSDLVTDSLSISFWINKTSGETGRFGNQIDGIDGNGYIAGGFSSGNMSFCIRTDDTSDCRFIGNNVTITDDVWTHFILTADSDVWKLYKNGDLVSTNTTTSWTANDSNFYISGSINSAGTLGGKLVSSTLDEMGIWGRELNLTEVTQLYNGGLGLEYNVILTTSLNSPEDNNVSLLKEIEFNCSAETGGGATVTNMSLWTNETGDWEVRNSTTGLTGSSETETWNRTFSGEDIILWSCQACNSEDTCNFASANRTFKVSRLSKTTEYYLSSTTSGATNPFNITFQTNGTAITTAYLYYNNTNHLGSISSSGNNYTLSRNQVAPGVSSTTNISFYWNLTMEDGFNYNTSAQNQTVNPIVINATCTGMYKTYTFTLVDEITQNEINETAKNSSIKVDLDLYNSARTTILKNYYAEFSKTNPVSICIDNNLSGGEQYSLDLQIQYSATNYSKELYHIERYVLNSSTLNQNTTLYDLETAETQSFRLLARDTSYLPIDDALIQIERKYIGNGTFYITEIPKTDAKGVTSASLQTDDVIYNFKIYQAGVLISTFSNVLAICQTPLVKQCEIDFNAFQTGVTIPDYEEGDDFNFTLGYNDTSKVVSSIFAIPSGEPSVVQLTVTKEDSLGTSVCSDALTSSAGTLSCIVPNSFGNSTVMVKLYKDGVEQGKGNIKLDQNPSEIFGVILTFLSVLVMMTLIGIGISDNPIVTGIFLFVGVMLLFAMNLVKNTGFIGATATILFLGIAIILVLIKAARRN